MDDKGIYWGGGPHTAWFTDPAGNVLSAELPPSTTGVFGPGKWAVTRVTIA